MQASSHISDRIVEAVLARKLAPGGRLGEGQLALLFGCSRTIVREALTRLGERGIIKVSAKRGWFLAEPSPADVQDVFEARLIIETGLLRKARPPGADVLGRLKAHLDAQRAAASGSDPALRSLLLGEFHVVLAESLGNRSLADVLRSLTVRTALAATFYQSEEDATRSCSEHAGIVAALEAGDLLLAEQRMGEHLGTWRAKLRLPGPDGELADLRQALRPIRAGQAHDLHTSLAQTVRPSKAVRSRL